MRKGRYALKLFCQLHPQTTPNGVPSHTAPSATSSGPAELSSKDGGWVFWLSILLGSWVTFRRYLQCRAFPF
eukprot:6470943-Amphidinium_carterae.1